VEIKKHAVYNRVRSALYKEEHMADKVEIDTQEFLEKLRRENRELVQRLINQKLRLKKVTETLDLVEEKLRRVKNREELLLSYFCWANGASQTQIQNNLVDSPNHSIVSLRTINTWVGWFKDIPKKDVELDKVGFHFHQMEEYGIPWDKYEEVMRLLEEYSAQENMELTPRMAKWAWRLQQIKNRTFDRDKAKTFIKRFVEAEQEELIGVESIGGLNKVSADFNMSYQNGIQNQ
jgi:hypothetical protein